MKRSLLILIGVLCINFAYSQSKMKEEERDSLIRVIADKLEMIEYKSAPVERFKLYKTENIYTFLKLDTATGYIEQLQCTLEEDKDGTVGIINGEDLSLLSSNAGTFELYPTSNMYQFILLDKRLGRTWHVQWGIGENKRWIRRTY